MDKRKNNGGARENSGRLKKDDLVSLIESMDAVLVPEEAWKKLADKVKENDVQAIKTWLSYRYGMPKQTVDNNTTLNVNDFNLKDVINFDNSKP
jgi:hypothetical protein